MHTILNELNKENGSIYKMKVLKKHSRNELLKRVLAMTYDKVRYTYGVTMKNVPEYKPKTDHPQSLEWALDILEDRLVTREATGHDALDLLHLTLEELSQEDALVLEKILNRDLRINMGRSNINKIFKKLIVKPPYMRCGIFNKKTASKIKYPAILQIKADGLAIFTTVMENEVICNTRNGEEFKLDSLQNLKNNPELINKIIQGEFLIDTKNRSESNGLINSLIKYKQGTNKTLTEEDAQDIENKIVYQVWDLIPLEEYGRPKDKKNKTIYDTRFTNLKQALKA